MNPVRQWVRDFPEAEPRAITDVLQLATLAKIRRALRMFEDSANKEAGPSLNIELLSTCNSEPWDRWSWCSDCFPKPMA